MDSENYGMFQPWVITALLTTP
ncbi:mCG125155 [Mus musculus]|nr:mCG125155 [Mus musculus]